MFKGIRLTGIVEASDKTRVEHPNIDELSRAFDGPMGVKSWVLTGVFVLACFYTLYLARAFILPIVIATVLSFLLSPMVRALKKARFPEFIGAMVVMLGMFAVIAGIFYEVSGPVADWLQRAPEIGEKIKGELQHLQKPVVRASQQVENLTKLAPSAGPKPQPVEIRSGSPLGSIFSWTWDFFLTAAVVVILLYFLLAAGDLFLRKLIHVLPRLQDKKKAVQIAREVEDNISKYLITIAIINSCLGTAGGLVFWALGMPNPFLWGALAGVLNFIPYLGALTVIIITTLVATATFSSIEHALLVPVCYFVLCTLEGNFITPWILGRRLTLNPVVIFVGLTFWGWLWGIPGALLAVPMLAMFKIFCDHIEPLAPIGEFLGN
jgi:predicted PurR-regulated permease PerM